MAGRARRHPDVADFRYRHPIEIRYVDTDALGHVNNAVYLSYFEMARAGYYAQLLGHAFGTGARADRETFVIAHVDITYRSAALFGEPLACWCRVSWAGRSSFGLEYLVTAEGSPLGPVRTCAFGSSVQVFAELATGRVMRMPAELLERMGEFEARPLPRRGPEPGSASVTAEAPSGLIVAVAPPAAGEVS